MSKKKAVFAKTVKKWKKGKDGLDIVPINKQLPFPSIFDQVPEEDIQNILQKTSPSYAVGDKERDRISQIPWENIAAVAAPALDFLIPGEKTRNPVLRPSISPNSNLYGSGNGGIMQEGGKVKKKIDPKFYTPFGKDGEKAVKQGWYPSSTNTGAITYYNQYGLLNSVEVPNSKKKGRISITGNSNGMFDVNIENGDAKPIKTLAKGVPYSEVDKYFTSQGGMIDQRVSRIGEGTASILKSGGDISPEKAKKILHDGTIRGKKITDKQRRFFGAKSNAENGESLQYEEGESYDLHPEEIRRLVKNGYKLEYL